MSVEKLMNILYYNFNWMYYHFGRILLVWLNPFCWLSNLSKIKLGRNIFKRQMERNYPSFLDESLRSSFFLQYSRIFFFSFLFVEILLFTTFVLLMLQIYSLQFYVIAMICSFITIFLTANFVFADDKYVQYHKFFYKEKKYYFPLPIFLITTALIIVDIFILSKI